ncbi:MAG: hypothetical protein HY720_15775 [Planctomycetes bacterium]|nr:hypothetical protein [Planctomycetota bacterium]
MPQPELLSLETLLERLRAHAGGQGNLPRHVRLCEGTDPKEGNKVFSQRLFIGLDVFWIDTAVDSERIRAALEKEGYESHATQRVPDGFGRNYDSIYYGLKSAAPGTSRSNEEGPGRASRPSRHSPAD